MYMAKTDKYRITIKFSFHMSNNLEVWLKCFLHRAKYICSNYSLYKQEIENYECYFKKMHTPIGLSTK